MAQQSQQPGAGGATKRYEGTLPPEVASLFGPPQGPVARQGPGPGGPMQAAPGAAEWNFMPGTYGKSDADQQRLIQQAMMVNQGLAPGGYPQTPQTPVPPMEPSGKPLGLGLGLRPGQRRGFQEAARTGRGAEWLGEHEKIARRVEQRIRPGSERERELQEFVGTGISPRQRRLAATLR
jgi:hypothetical protein